MAKGIDKKLDDAWAILVKLRAGTKCEYCGKETHLNAHHIYSRSKRSTRWDTQNGISLCVAHHVFSSGFSAHKTPLEFIDWLKTYKSEEQIDSLRLKAHSTVKYMKFEKEQMLDDLQKEIYDINKRL